MARHPWILAIVYVVVSLAVEASLMVIGHLQVPRDNAILAPVVLTVPPVVAAWICGYRRLKPILVISVLLGVLTLFLTLVISKLTGVSTGMAEPIFNRALAGSLAGVIGNRCLTRKG